MAVLLLSACQGKVVIHDSEVCGILGPAGAHCANTLTPKTRDLTKEQWDAESLGKLCMDSVDFSATETSLDQICSISSVRCTYETKKMIKTMVVKLHALMIRVKAARLKYGVAKKSEVDTFSEDRLDAIDSFYVDKDGTDDGVTLDFGKPECTK